MDFLETPQGEVKATVSNTIHSRPVSVQSVTLRRSLAGGTRKMVIYA
jgi:hypothetical protein